MPNFLLPLSGDVNQVINPWTWMTKTVGRQFGFINIDLGKSADPLLEQQILHAVDNYGRQIGQLRDALEEVLVHLQAEKWRGESKRAVDAFRLQLAQVNRLKAKRKGLAAT